jgi:hypothetical protein
MPNHIPAIIRPQAVTGHPSDRIASRATLIDSSDAGIARQLPPAIANSFAIPAQYTVKMSPPKTRTGLFSMKLISALAHANLISNPTLQ